MNEKKVLGWVHETDESVLAKMFKKKLDPNYVRPSHLDIFAQQVIVASQRPTCMFYEVAAIIFADGSHFLSSGYNGPASGDVDPREAGCARVVDGKIQEGKGLCRGSHAELNAINNLTVSTIGLPDVSIMVTLHPCYSCAKQIVNKGIKKVYYIWDYRRERFVTGYFHEMGVDVIKYTSPLLEKWIALNKYDPIGVTNMQE